MSRPRFEFWFAVFGLAAGIAFWLPAFASPDAARVRLSRHFRFTYVVKVPATARRPAPAGRPATAPRPATPGRELRLWVPLPQADRYQTISGLRIISPVPYRVERAAEGNLDAYFVLRGRQLGNPAEIQIQFDVLRRERVTSLPTTAREPAPASWPAREPRELGVQALRGGLAGAELTPYLKPNRMIPLDGIIAQLSAQTTQGIADPLEKARKIYEYVVAHMRYDKTGTGWGRGDAVWACSSHRGNCTDFHSLFIGMARTAGIPARFHIGFPLPEDRHQGEIPGYHCWAEFYLDGAGWVPIDASEAWLNPSRHNFYFGSLDPDRVKFTVGRDLDLAPPQAGEPVNFFVYPYAELDGKRYDGVEHQFFFRDLNP